jgi:hypothetical protein
MDHSSALPSLWMERCMLQCHFWLVSFGKKERGETCPVTKSLAKICCMISLPYVKPPRHYSHLSPFEPSRARPHHYPVPLGLTLSQCPRWSMACLVFENMPSSRASSPLASLSTPEPSLASHRLCIVPHGCYRPCSDDQRFIEHLAVIR